MRFFLLLSCVLFLVGCAPFKFESNLNPQYENLKFKKIIIDINVASLTQRLKYEKIIIQDLQALGIQSNFVSESEHFFDGNPPDFPTLYKYAVSENCDGVLAIGLSNTQTNTSTLDFGSTTSGTITKGAFGNYEYTQTQQNNTYTYPVYSVFISVDLGSINDRVTAWHAESNAEGGLNEPYNDMMNRLFGDLAKEIAKHSFFY